MLKSWITLKPLPIFNIKGVNWCNALMLSAIGYLPRVWIVTILVEAEVEMQH